MDRLKDLLETAGKALLLVAGACYVIGLFVVNIHLSRYGFYSLNLLQLNYVTAGIWALFPILILVFIIVYVLGALFSELDSTHPSSWKGKLIAVGYGILVGGVGVFFVVKRIVASLGVGFGWRLLGLLGLGAVVGLFSLGSVHSVRSEGAFSTFKSGINALHLGFITLLFFVVYLNYFTAELYKDLPAAFGGGRPHDVRLVVEPSAKPFLENAGLQFVSEVQTQPLQLIVSTDKEYVLLTNQSQNAVSIPMVLVKAVIFEK